jgi:uncharacterized protein YdbL (DUF1318 family)
MFKFLLSVVLLAGTVAFVGGSVYAQGKYSIKEMTPQVQEALNNRRERFDQLRVLKHSGAVGENNQGYVEVLRSEGQAVSLVASENKDRKIIYRTIAEQNGLDNALGTIEAVFAQVQRDKADSGDKIQNENGSWTSK